MVDSRFYENRKGDGLASDHGQSRSSTKSPTHSTRYGRYTYLKNCVYIYIYLYARLVGGGLEKLLLEMVSCGRLKLQSDVSDFIDCTLMRTQQPEHIVSGCNAAITIPIFIV